MCVNIIALKKIIGERVQAEGIINVDVDVDLGYLDNGNIFSLNKNTALHSEGDIFNSVRVKGDSF